MKTVIFAAVTFAALGFLTACGQSIQEDNKTVTLDEIQQGKKIAGEFAVPVGAPSAIPATSVPAVPPVQQTVNVSAPAVAPDPVMAPPKMEESSSARGHCPQYRVNFSAPNSPAPDNFDSLKKGFEEFLAGEAIEGCRHTPAPSYWPQSAVVGKVGEKTCLEIPDFKIQGKMCYQISLRE